MRKRQKVGFAREQHFALGNQLASMEATLNRAVIDPSHAYSVNGREVRSLERACRAVEWARCMLDDAICREQPRLDWSVTDAYYPREHAVVGPDNQTSPTCPTCPK